jgi:serine/threonine protein kinase
VRGRLIVYARSSWSVIVTDAATLVNPSVALDETIATAAPGPDRAGTLPLPASPATTLQRTTVLPRVEMHGATPRLVAQGKPRYEHTRRLGEGGLGEVIGAHDNDIGRNVAVKKLRPEVTSEDAIARFVQEVRTIGQLEHPNIVPIHDVGVDEHGDYYFVMKYVDGETLESIIDKLAAGDPLTHARYGFERRVQLFLGLLEAVAFAHERGIVHRDIKPANVMVGAHGEVMLMDWGIAKQLRGPGAVPLETAVGAALPPSKTKRGTLFATQAGSLIGTPAYMSPEQARGEPADERSDIYSLCMLLHELLCLSHPLADKPSLAAMLQGVQNEPTPMATFVKKSPHQPPVPSDLGWLLQKGLAKAPADRYQSVSELIDRLARRAEGVVPIQCPITLVQRMNSEWSRFVDRHPQLVSLAMLAVVLAIIGRAIMAVVQRVR